MIDTCPHCGRKLMTHTSPICNWCGQRIEDKGYQSQAKVNRINSHLYGEMGQVAEEVPPAKKPRFLRMVASDSNAGLTFRFIATPEQSTYAQLREQALVLRPNGIEDELGAFEPYAAAMEIGTADSVTTLVVTVDGSVSLFYSAGGGIVGGGDHPKVRRAGRDFMDACRKSTHLLKISSSHPTPEVGRVRFYVLAPSVSYTRETAEADIVEGRSQLAPLFEPASRALTELRRLAEEA